MSHALISTIAVSSTGKELRSPLRARITRMLAGLSLAAGVFAAAPAAADPLQQLSWAAGTPGFNVVVQSVAPGTLSGSVTTRAGAFSGTFNGSPLISYCIELVQNISLPSGILQYTAAPVASAPVGGVSTPMGVAKANDLSRLFGSYYTTSLTSVVNSAAMQLAIWEIVYETNQTYALGTGTFTASNVTGTNYVAARDLANTWLAELGNVFAPLMALTSSTNQDFITVVPVPPSAALFAGGLLFGLWSLRRRRTA